MSEDSRKSLKEKGKNIRREVLGAKHVDAAIAKANDFNLPMQELLHEYCWGATWGDETLSRQERSMINLAMLTALGRSHEVAVHVRGALNNGLSKEQISAILIQTAIYCGVPAAVDSFRVATQVIEEYDND